MVKLVLVNKMIKRTEYGQTLYDEDYDVTTYRALVGYLTCIKPFTCCRY